MSKQEGWQVKVRIGGTPFRVRRVERDDTAADLEVGDSEAGQYEEHQGGRKVCRITLENASYDPAENPFSPPFSLVAGAHTTLEIYWAGLGEAHDDFPDCLVTSAKVSADVTGLEPCSFTLISSRAYTLAGG